MTRAREGLARTGLSEGDITDDVRDAARVRGIALLAREQLEELEEFGLRRNSTRRLLDYLRSLIPKERTPGLLDGA